jgi:hypothetical protein
VSKEKAGGYSAKITLMFPALLPWIILSLKPRTSFRLSLRITFSLAMGELMYILPSSFE